MANQKLGQKKILYTKKPLAAQPILINKYSVSNLLASIVYNPYPQTKQTPLSPIHIHLQYKSMANTLQQINQKLLKINTEYQQVFTNPQSKRVYLNKKQFSLLFQKIYSFVQNGTKQTKTKHKQLFLTLFRTYLKNFINSHIFASLSKAYHYEDFQQILSEKWKNFKQFTFYYFALLQSSNQFFQNAYITSLQKNIHLNLNSQTSNFPIPVLALNYFKTIILDQFQQKIQHIVLQGIKSYRKNMKQKTQSLKNIIELIWCCGLGELARVRAMPGAGIVFYQQEKTQFINKVKPSRTPEQFFSQKILKKILQQTQSHYTQEYESKIIPLFPIEQFKTINSMIKKQFEFSEEFFVTKKQRKVYMTKVYDRLVNDLPQRLRVPGGLKSLIQNYKYSSEEGFEDIRLYFDVIKDSGKINPNKFKKILQIIEAILTQVILQQGKQINLKINKRREHILQMLSLKKSIDKILEEMTNKNIVLFSAKDRAFKKILDSIEAARNLADHTDFTIKECIRLKLDQERCLEKFSDVFLLLNSVTSTDSFLLYHQELMGKRIVESLNEPKLQYELLMLKKLSERMGVMSVSSHMSMVKDMELSQQMTQKYNNRLPFSSFKWSLKIFNPSFWPQNINRQKLNIQFPNSLLHQAKAIEDLYHTQNQYRYLNWKLQKGTSLFEGRYGGRKVRFQSENSYLMILLLIAQQSENRIIYGNLNHLVRLEKTGQETMTKHDPLAMLVYVLIENRLVSRKNVQDKYAPFSQSQQIQINKNYTLPQNLPKGQQVVMIRPSQQMAKNLQQSSIQKGKIMKDRQKLIEAILVKVLKHAHATKQNSVTFSDLYQAIKQHHILGGFNFSQGIVKQKLQQLIAREFCVRDQDDRKVYHYVA